MRKVPALAAYGVSLFVGFGILTLFLAARWPTSVVEAGLLIQAAALLAWAGFRDVRLHWHPVLLPVGCTAIGSALQASTGFSAAPWLSGEKSLQYAATFAALLLIAQTANRSAWRARLSTALLVFGTLLSLVTLLHVASATGKAFWLFETGYTELVAGPFVSRNTFAQFVEILFPLALYQAIRWRRRAPLMVFVAGILFASEVAGASRAGTLILLAEIPLVLWLSHHQGLISRRTVALYMLCLTGALAFLAFFVGWNSLLARLGEDPVTDLRWPIMSSSFNMLKDHLWLGVGYGAWPVVYPQYATFDLGLVVNQAHCDWLQMAGEGGIAGLGLFVWSIATLFKGLLRSVWGIGFFGVLCHACVDFPFQHRPAFTIFLFCAALLAASGAARPTRVHRTSHRGHDRPRHRSRHSLPERSAEFPA